MLDAVLCIQDDDIRGASGPPTRRMRAPESVVYSSILGLADPALEVTNDIRVRRSNTTHGLLVGLPVLVS